MPSRAGVERDADLSLRAPRHGAAEDSDRAGRRGRRRPQRGRTILGADDKSAVAAMLEAARRCSPRGRPHAGIELLFTPKEEVGLVGAAASTTRG